MSRMSLTTFMCVSLLVASAGAQTATTAVQGEATRKPAAEQAATATTVREPVGQAVNVRLELTITDQAGPGEPARKIVTMIVADRSPGSIRSAGNNVRAMLNVDATPQILPNGNVKVQLGLEYNPRQASTTRSVKTTSGDTLELTDGGGSSLNQRVAIVLEPGKPLMLSQAADPMSDRKVTVEIRATVLR